LGAFRFERIGEAEPVLPAQHIGWFRDRRIRSFTHRTGPTMEVVETPIDKLVPYACNPRRNEEAVATVAASLAEFGWRQPIVVDEDMVIVVGHTRYEAAKRLGMPSSFARKSAPTGRLSPTVRPARSAPARPTK
jgi:hypothetical protein